MDLICKWWFGMNAAIVSPMCRTWLAVAQRYVMEQVSLTDRPSLIWMEHQSPSYWTHDYWSEETKGDSWSQLWLRGRNHHAVGPWHCVLVVVVAVSHQRKLTMSFSFSAP